MKNSRLNFCTNKAHQKPLQTCGCMLTQTQGHGHTTLPPAPRAHQKTRVRVHLDKNHVALTGSPPILPRPPSPETLVGVGCKYTLTFSGISLHPAAFNYSSWNTNCICCHCFFFIAAKVAQKWRTGCFQHKRRVVGCIDATGVSQNEYYHEAREKSLNTPRGRRNYTLLSPFLSHSHSTHSTACSLTANYRTPLKKADVPSQCFAGGRWALYVSVRRGNK